MTEESGRERYAAGIGTRIGDQVVALNPRASLSVLDGVAMVVGIVIGVGIFKTPQLVAANVGSEAAFIGAWVLGGVITLIGALVYAELATAHPSTGGEYRLLARAFGQTTGFLFAWARISVIQTGAIAAVAFVFGEYAQQMYSLGPFGTPIYAAAALGVLTLVNLAGTFRSKLAQNVLAGLTLLAVRAGACDGLTLTGGPAPAPAPADSTARGNGAFGLAMIFILLTYGGWNEAAYLSAEMRDTRRNMVRVLVFGTLVVAAVYLLINFAYLRALGLEGLRSSDAAAAEMMRRAAGEKGAWLLSAVICFAALSTLNATVFTGARVYHALGQDVPALRRLGRWDGDGNHPRNAILMQSAIALSLVGFGALAHDGFQAMVEYTAPVFWLFLLLVGLSYFVLRRREPERQLLLPKPLQVLLPVVFCLTCAYQLYSSIAYTGVGALAGVGILLLGLPLLVLVRRKQPAAAVE
jgi:basic amino acid/polyamine antiporter, APA family